MPTRCVQSVLPEEQQTKAKYEGRKTGWLPVGRS